MSSVSSKGRDRLSRLDLMANVKRLTPKRPRVVAPAGPFASVGEAIDDIRRGKMVIVVDDEDRENEGDLTMAAELATPEDVAFIRKYASGVICVPMTAERLKELDLPQMVSRNEARLGTAFTVSVDAREGVTTGISASDRARTIRVLADPETKANDVGEPVLVRVHDECLTGDTFHSIRCDCGEQLEVALKRIAEEGRGVLLYLRQEGRGIGLMNKLRAYALQDQGLDTVEANERLGFKADERERGVSVQILLDLGVRRARILTNNPQKLVPLYGLEVVERIPIEVPPRATNRGYLATKRNKLGHMLTVIDRES